MTTKQQPGLIPPRVRVALERARAALEPPDARELALAASVNDVLLEAYAKITDALSTLLLGVTVDGTSLADGVPVAGAELLVTGACRSTAPSQPRSPSTSRPRPLRALSGSAH